MQQLLVIVDAWDSSLLSAFVGVRRRSPCALMVAFLHANLQELCDTGVEL